MRAFLILVYIAFRFEFKSGIVGLLALIHDVLAVIGLFAIMHKEVDATFIAAILTILGYSINDTIVIFDRIRENLRFRKKGQTYDDLVNLSILQTMRRSLNTSVTTALAILVLYLLAVRPLKLLLGHARRIGWRLSAIFVTGPRRALGGLRRRDSGNSIKSEILSIGFVSACLCGDKRRCKKKATICSADGCFFRQHRTSNLSSTEPHMP